MTPPVVLKLTDGVREKGSGEIKEVMDRSIDRWCVQIRGHVSANTMLTFQLSQPQRFLYIELRPVSGRPLAIHLDATVGGDSRIRRVTLSTMYKGQKSAGRTLRLPLELAKAASSPLHAPSTSWHVLALDMQQILPGFHMLKSAHFCCDMILRGVCGSNEALSWDSMPRSLSFPLPPGLDWADRYTWKSYPSKRPEGSDKCCPVACGNTGPSPTPIKRQGEVPKATRRKKDAAVSPSPPPPGLPLSKHSAAAANSSTSTSMGGGMPKTSGGADSPPPPPAPVSVSNGIVCQEIRRPPTTPIALPAAGAKTRAKTSVGSAVVTSNSFLPASVPGVPAKALGHQADNPWAISPDPAVELQMIMGYSGGRGGGELTWAESGASIAYSRSRDVVLANPSQPSSQNLLRGHSKAVTHVELSSRGNLLATGEGGGGRASAVEGLVRIWNLESTSKECVAHFLAHPCGLDSIAWSADDKYICTVGGDAQRRTQIIVWTYGTLAEARRGSGAAISSSAGITRGMAMAAKQISDLPIARIRFSPFERLKLVSCGRENVRFWRVKRECLPALPGLLNEFARDAEFTDLAFESVYSPGDPNPPRGVFASTSAGTVVKMDSQTRQLISVLQLHDAGISCIRVGEGFVATGSVDGCIRLWPQDFTDFLMEVKTEVAVESVAISRDGLQLAVGISNGSIGVLNIASASYETCIRSHSSAVLDIAMDPSPERMHCATASFDGSVRIWDASSGKQAHEFRVLEDTPSCLYYAPYRDVGAREHRHHLAVGFSSGFVRIFDVPSAAVLCEFLQHSGAVGQVLYSPDGTMLFSAGYDGLIFVFDTVTAFTPIKAVDLRNISLNSAVRMAVSPDGSVLAVVGGSSSEVVVLYDSRTMEVRRRYGRERKNSTAAEELRENNPGALQNVQFSNDGQNLLVSSRTKLMRIAFGSPMTPPWSSPLPFSMSKMSLSATSHRVWGILGCPEATMSDSEPEGRLLCLCHIQQSDVDASMAISLPQVLDGHSAPVTTVAFTQDGLHIVTADADGTIFFWNRHAPQRRQSSDAAEKQRRFSQLSQLLEEVKSDAMISVAAARAEEVKPPTVDSTALHVEEEALEYLPESVEESDVAASPGPALLLTWSSSGGVVVWGSKMDAIVLDLESGERYRLRGHSCPVTSLALDSDGLVLATGALYDSTIIWRKEARTGAWGLALRLTGGGGARSLAFTEDGEQLIVLGCPTPDGQQLSICNATTGITTFSRILTPEETSFGICTFDGSGASFDITFAVVGAAGLTVWGSLENEYFALGTAHNMCPPSSDASGDDTLIVTAGDGLASSDRYCLVAGSGGKIMSFEWATVADDQGHDVKSWEAFEGQAQAKMSCMAGCSSGNVICAAENGLLSCWHMKHASGLAQHHITVDLAPHLGGAKPASLVWAPGGLEGLLGTDDGSVWYVGLGNLTASSTQSSEPVPTSVSLLYSPASPP
jgi:WD40 repeat protein